MAEHTYTISTADDATHARLLALAAAEDAATVEEWLTRYMGGRLRDGYLAEQTLAAQTDAQALADAVQAVSSTPVDADVVAETPPDAAPEARR